MVDKNNDMLWAVVALKNQLFAISVDDIQSMIPLPAVYAMPETPPQVRGVINFRGQVAPLIDLRIALGMQPLKLETEELLEMLCEREEDHKRWLLELENSIREHREFKLAKDPHECAFGKWYDSYETDNLLINIQLKKFDEPHKRIHAVADKALRLQDAGDMEAAQKVIDETRDGDLAKMITLFEKLRTSIAESIREIVIVLSVKDHIFGLSVDYIETVGKLVQHDSENLNDDCESILKRSCVTSIGKIEHTNQLVLILDSSILSDSKNLQSKG